MEARTRHTKMLLDLYRHAVHFTHLEKDKQAKRENPNNNENNRKRDNGLELG